LNEANERWINRLENERKNLVKDGSGSASAPGAWLAGDESQEAEAVAIDAAVGHDGPGSFCLAGGKEATFYQEVPVKKGNGRNGFYGIRAWVRQTGVGDPKIRIRWKQGKDRYLLTQSDHLFLSPEPGGKEGDWRLIRGVVVIPPGVETLVVQLVASGQTTAADRIWFDDVGVYRID